MGRRLAFGWEFLREKMCQTVCKPGSVPTPGGAGDGHSSGTPVTGRLARPTRTTARKPASPVSPANGEPGVPSLLGLAPGGVYRAAPVAGGAVRSYRTLSPLPAGRGPQACDLGARDPGRRFAFCGTFPGVTPAGRYPAPCFRGARTFLPPRPEGRERRPSDRLARYQGRPHGRPVKGTSSRRRSG